MIKILDYYYLVLLRGFGEVSYYNAIGLMALTFIINFFSFVILFNHHILDQNAFWISIFIIWPITYLGLVAIYNKKYRETLRERYKDESRESRQMGVVKIVIYEVLSIAFLILALSTLERPHP